MKPATQQLWAEQDRHPGDRLRLFAAVAEFVGDTTVLYPGSFVDIAPSFVFDTVTYVDSDRRAAKFFGDENGVDELIEQHRTRPGRADWRFLATDYRSELEVPPVGLLVSLYAGLISEHCTGHLQPGGWLLANPSHGDVAMAALDPRYTLGAVIDARSSRYSISDSRLHEYLVPKRPIDLTPELVRERGRGIAYTKSPFAYLFQRTDVSSRG